MKDNAMMHQGNGNISRLYGGKLLLLVLLCAVALTSCGIPQETMQKGMSLNRSKEDPLALPHGNCITVTDALHVDRGDGLGCGSNNHGEAIVMRDRPNQVCGGDNQNRGVASWVIRLTERNFSNGVESVFQQFQVGFFPFVVQSMGTIAIAIYSIALVMGMTNATAWAIIVNYARIITIFYFSAAPAAWGLFKEYVMDFLENIIQDMVFIMSSAFSPGAFTRDPLNTGATNPSCDGGLVGGECVGTFSIIDETISMFYSAEFWWLVWATIFSGATGWWHFGLLMAAIVGYSVTLVNALFFYLTALVIRALLYAVGPIFIAFAMFKQTRELFTGWVTQLLSFTFQPIFMFTAIGMFHGIIEGLKQTLLNGDTFICYREFKIFPGNWIRFNWWQFGDGSEQNPVIAGFNSDPPIDGWGLIIITIVTWLMTRTVIWAANAASSISGGFVSMTNNPAFNQEKVANAGTVGKVAASGFAYNLGTGRAFSPTTAGGANPRSAETINRDRLS